MLKLSDYDYELPESLIAQKPANPRDSCRLLVLNRKTGEITDDVFKNLDQYLNSNDLLVFNNSRVIPARVFGKKESGGKVELLLLHEQEKNVWEALVRPGRRLNTGTKISLAVPNKTVQKGDFFCQIIGRNGNGTRIVQFSGCENVRDLLSVIGEIPLPPYIKHPECSPEDYQTIYSQIEGSVAAPTAGLHFTEGLMERLRALGVEFSEITLHIGWGTFRPVHSENILEHSMEKEWYSISNSAAEKINAAAREGRKMVAVGTTACRVLESFPPGEISAGSGFTNLFIYPGFQFKRVNALITNFHLPKSTLLMLVSAFAGHEQIFRAYQEAVRLKYRFYSFGDAMLIL
ncbi:MAG: tRNA preQ1(34) S-adenosylmethionine ribosyltransferase-isomerase QueA [Firmicutes bacterium]|nr:tRNA preQ1(34) S-adenosylmethionine ribosyltransferase-isomerase QueA [Bacillota bacterium]